MEFSQRETTPRGVVRVAFCVCAAIPLLDPMITTSYNVHRS